MFNDQLEKLMEVLKKGRIWAVNIGENFQVSLPHRPPPPLYSHLNPAPHSPSRFGRPPLSQLILFYCSHDLPKRLKSGMNSQQELHTSALVSEASSPPQLIPCLFVTISVTSVN